MSLSTHCYCSFLKTVSFLFVLAVSALVWGCSSKEREAVWDDPRSVVILVNRQTPPDPALGKASASIELGRHYALKRGIPVSNIIQLNTEAEEEISFSRFNSEIREPLRKRLDEIERKTPVRYLVSVYGVPSRLTDLPVAPAPDLPQRGFSVDSFLASLRSGNDRHWIENPYRALSTAEEKIPFPLFHNPRKWQMYLVTRLDGPSPARVRELVDRTIAAEKNLDPRSGVGYFDFRHLGDTCGEYCDADRGVLRAYQRCTNSDLRCELNDQKISGAMIQRAPDALWAWGWYSERKISGEYQFVPGAVGAQLTSFTANRIRTRGDGAWVPEWIERGITATWGATGEPYTSGYASGDILLSKFWGGYNFAEAAYMASPNLNWMMVFIGDPLYRPRAFRVDDRRPPEIADLAYKKSVVDHTEVIITFRTDEPGDTLVAWGEGNGVGELLKADSQLTKDHSLAVGPLKDGVRYTMQARTRDRLGNESISEILTFGW